MSASFFIFSRDSKPDMPSAKALGGSFCKTLIPNARAARATLEPTLPTPIIPTHIPDKLKFCIIASVNRAEITYCSTEEELQPGAFVQEILFFLQYSVSIWS